MRKVILGVILAAGLLAAACGGSEPGGQAASSAPPARVEAPSPPPAVIAEPQPAVAPAAFFLQVLTPEDQIVVHEKTLRVAGRTTPDAVVSVNGLVVNVDADGNFVVMLGLEEGPNAIEVVASDFQGNQTGQVLMVVYAPG